MVRSARQPVPHAGDETVVTTNPITYRVWHRTAYRYERMMTDGYTVAYVLPRSTPSQNVIETTVTFTPEPDEVDRDTDVFGNDVMQFGVHRGHDELVIEVTSTVELTPPSAPGASPPWESVRDTAASLVGSAALDTAPFIASSPFVDVGEHRLVLYELASMSFTPGRPIVDAVIALCHDIFTTFDYDPSFSELSTPLDAVLANRRGVCQDFAHLSVGALRTLGLPARYVSGYIETEPPPGEARTFGADASHAWCSVWIGDSGWLDLDPTNDHVPPTRHVTTAWGRDYGDVTPVRGVVIGPASTQTLDVNVDVSRVG